MSPAGFEATAAYRAFNRGRLPPDPYPLYRAMRETALARTCWDWPSAPTAAAGS